MKIINWFKNLFYVVKDYHIHKLVFNTNIDDLNKRMAWLETQTSHAVNIIKERTEISADIRLRGPNRNQIIIIGRYKKRDYVEVFTTTDKQLDQLIPHLKHLEKFGVIEKVDAPTGFKAIFKRDKF